MGLSKVKLISTTGFIFIGILVGIILTTQLEWTPKGLASKESAVTIDNSNSDANQSNFNLKNVGNSFTQVSKAILPTVVSISTSKIIKQSSPFWTTASRYVWAAVSSVGAPSAKTTGIGFGCYRQQGRIYFDKQPRDRRC